MVPALVAVDPPASKLVQLPPVLFGVVGVVGAPLPASVPPHADSPMIATTTAVLLNERFMMTPSGVIPRNDPSGSGEGLIQPPRDANDGRGSDASPLRP